MELCFHKWLKIHKSVIIIPLKNNMEQISKEKVPITVWQLRALILIRLKFSY